MVPSSLGGLYAIRFCVCKETATEADMDYAWKVIKEFSEIVKILYKGKGSMVNDSLISATTLSVSEGINAEAKQFYKMAQQKREHFFMQQTTGINEIMARTSVDMTESGELTQRGRKASFFAGIFEAGDVIKPQKSKKCCGLC